MLVIELTSYNQGSTNAKIHSRHFGDRHDFTVAKPDFTVARFFCHKTFKKDIKKNECSPFRHQGH